MLRLLAVLLLVMPAAAPTPVVVRVDLSGALGADSELAAVRQQYVAAMNAGDASRVAALYLPDVLAIYTDGILLRGQAELERRFARALSAPTPSGSVTLLPRQFAIADEIGSESGTFLESIDGKAGVEGVYVTIYSRDGDGRWRIAMEVRTTGPYPSAVAW